MQVNDFITQAISALTANKLLAEHTSTPRLDAELLLCHSLQRSRTWLLTWPDYELEEQQEREAMHLLKRRLTGEPVAYILGKKPFWSLMLKVNPSTLIPRPDTEQLVEASLITPGPDYRRVLDLGTGTGAIALALAKEHPAWQITAVDFQSEAVILAKENAVLNQINNVDCLQSDWFSALTGQHFDVIVSNPPYIEDNDPHLSQGDVRFEPKTALTSGTDGLDAIRHITAHAHQHLNPMGWLLFEHGYNQGSSVRTILRQYGFSKISTRQDLSGLDRITQGQLADE